uniref:PiggyBac transposable element-derived protein domain-containing protein n=1 Tax=Dicentrarchus labrax TaxID=13489 RepID=A0A8P4FX73_DICLA
MADSEEFRLKRLKHEERLSRVFDEVMGLGDFADSSRGSATSSRSGGQDETKEADKTSGPGEDQHIEEEHSNGSRQEEKMDEGMGEPSFPRISSPSSDRHSSFTMGTNEGGGRGGRSGGAAFDDAVDGLEDDEDWHFALPMGSLEGVGKGNKKQPEAGNSVTQEDPFAHQPRDEEEEPEREGSSESANTSHSSQDHTPDNSQDGGVLNQTEETEDSQEGERSEAAPMEDSNPQSPINIKDEPIDEGYDAALLPQSSIRQIKEELEHQEEELRISSVYSVGGGNTFASPTMPAALPAPPPAAIFIPGRGAVLQAMAPLPVRPQVPIQSLPALAPVPPRPPQPSVPGSVRCSGCSKMAKKLSVEDVLKMIMDGNSSDMEQLEESEEEEDAEWTPMCTEENSDSSDEEELDEGVDHTSAEVKDPTLPQDTTKQSARGKVKKYQWKKKKFEPPDVKFDECVEEESEVRHDWTPYMYFKDFVTDEMLQEIAEQTNLYSVQKEEKSVNTTAKEIEQVLGMYMHMGLVQMPNVRAYWEMETKHSTVCDVMSRDRFLKLLTLIHFQDNLNVSDDAKKDKLWKLRPWLQKLREQFLCIPPEECHVVDEIMVPFKGKSHLRVYMPAKPHKWGFKMWGRAGQSGFLYDFDICQGAENPDQVKSDVGATGHVVLKLTSTLPAGKNHKVFADNYFTSVPLVEHLKERGIYYIGTVRMNRVKDCDMMDEKEMKKKGRGTLDFRVNQDNAIIVRWYDNKAVNLLSSFVGIEPLGNVKRWDRKSKTHMMVPRPAIIETYNKFMGGVKLLDMLSALYKFSFRSRRWYMYIWWHTVTVAVINAWNLYRRDHKKLKPRQKPMPLRRFQAAVATSLTSAGKGKIKNGSLQSSSPEAAPPPRKRPTFSVPPDVRKDGIDHFPTWEARQRCKHCTGNHFTHVYCGKCKVHLCLNKDRNCFQAYHNTK